MAKVFKNGNSLAVTVPQVYAHELNITNGTSVKWDKNDRGLTLIPDTAKKAATEIDPEVAKLIKKISKKYAQVWEELAKV